MRKLRSKLNCFALVTIVGIFLFMGTDGPPLKLQPDEFKPHYSTFKRVVFGTPEGLKFSQKSTNHITNKSGTISFVLRAITKDELARTKDWQIILFKNKKPFSQLTINQCDSVEAKWVGHELLFIESWPGRAIELNELLNAETGKILYRSAWTHIFAE